MCGTLNGVALLFTPVRSSHSLKDGGILGFMVGGPVFIGLVAGLAAYLCSLDHRRTAPPARTAASSAWRSPPTCTTSSLTTLSASWSPRS